MDSSTGRREKAIKRLVLPPDVMDWPLPLWCRNVECLQCPFNWMLMPMSLEEIEFQEHFMSICEPAWDNVCYRIGAAYSLILANKLKKAREYLVQLYMILLDKPYLLKYQDNSLRRYRPALKHVVDSMWVRFCMYCHLSRSGFAGYVKTVQDGVYERIVNDITPFNSFDLEQRAAVFVIHGVIVGIRSSQQCLDLINKALCTYAEESMWHCMLGWYFQQKRLRGERVDVQAEINALENSVGLQRTPDNLRMLAFAYFGLESEDGYKKAQDLLTEMLTKWPGNARVLHFASILRFDRKSPLYDWYAAFECLNGAISAKGETPYLRYEMGRAFLRIDKPQDAQVHLDASKMPEAVNILRLISNKTSKKKLMKVLLNKLH